MSDYEYPELIESLPDADIPFDGVKGKLLQGENGQVVFFDIEPIGKVAEHSHGAQWGTVISGEMELTIGGETATYRKGDTYYIPAGVLHSAVFNSPFKAIDFFEENDRYSAKA